MAILTSGLASETGQPYRRLTRIPPANSQLVTASNDHFGFATWTSTQAVFDHSIYLERSQTRGWSKWRRMRSPEIMLGIHGPCQWQVSLHVGDSRTCKSLSLSRQNHQPLSFTCRLLNRTFHQNKYFDTCYPLFHKCILTGITSQQA